LYREKTRTRASIYTVSGLTSELKSCLEERYPFVWIHGEISGLSRPSSGHMYFTLKDSKAQISGVIFKNLGNHLTFRIENGLHITALARLSVYEPRGTYQLIFEHIEPKGTGALQLAFEQLKTKLSDEGLFDEVHKKQLPFLPRRISVITSPTGAVIHDIIHVISRRFPNVVLELSPVRVQGEHADVEIAESISMINQRDISDLIIIARGGGSLEDLAPFNTEILARAVFLSRIPVVSAVGHETDYTICDFVSDFRAPTPSAAAESVVPVKQVLINHITALTSRLKQIINLQVNRKRTQLEHRMDKLVDPKRRVIDNRLKTEDLTQRLIRSMDTQLSRQKNFLTWKHQTLKMVNPQKNILDQKANLFQINHRLMVCLKASIHERSMKLKGINGRLSALNPMSILKRGYSITRTLPDHQVIRDARDAFQDQKLEVILSKGRLVCHVKGTSNHGKEKF
jgi:exodeoxyribonuclease VII large subunit